MAMPIRAREDREANEERISVKFSRGRWGAIPEHILEDSRLGEAAKVLAAWLCIRPDGWVVRRSHAMAVLGFGKDKWQAARKQLLEAGYLSVQSGRTTAGRYGAPKWEFDAYPGQVPEMSTGAGFSGSGETGYGETGSGKPGRLPTPSKTRPVLTTPPPRLSEHGPSMGALLVDILGGDTAAIERVNRAAAGASAEQVALAIEEVRRQVGAGTARSAVALSVTLGKAAARGEMRAPSPAAKSVVAAEEAEAGWRRREAAVGRHVMHPVHGKLTVQPGGRTWMRERDHLAVAGRDGLKVWERVEAGELQLEEAASRPGPATPALRAGPRVRGVQPERQSCDA